MRLLGRVLLAFGVSSVASVAIADAQSRAYLADLAERRGTWVDHGDIHFPSGQIFFGDPTNGDDTHIRDPRPAAAPKGRLWTHTYDFIWEGDGSTGTQNGIVWIEFSGKMSVRKGERVGFGADAAVIGLGDLDGGKALVALGERWMDEGKGDSFEFLSPILLEGPYMFTKQVPIPQTGTSIHILTTGTDGGFDAVWLYDADDKVSGILIDIAGRESDLKFIDSLIPG